MAMTTAQSLINWFEQFRIFSSELSQSKTMQSIAQFESLLAGHVAIKSKIDYWEHKEASEFNIFNILKHIVHREEILHSPLLGELLDINGNHRQGRLFYDAFLRQLSGQDKLLDQFNPSNNLYFSMHLEKWTGDGAIDILLRYHSPVDSFAIAIENKVYAGDQPNQLERYTTYLQREFDNNFLLLYLTPWGSKPKDNSIKGEKFSALQQSGQIQLISYREHIMGFITETIQVIASEKVASIAKQYLQCIQKSILYE